MEVHSMEPTIGRIVIATGAAAHGNGAHECPAIITRVWEPQRADGSWIVNLTLFPDAAVPRFSTSASLFPTAEQARAYAPSTGAYWPPRLREATQHDPAAEQAARDAAGAGEEV